MRAIVTPHHGGIEVLEYHLDWPDPAVAPGEVLVAVGACGLNNTDVNTRAGWYSKAVEEGTGAGGGAGFGTTRPADAGWGGVPITFPLIQGADVCGRIAAVGAGVPAARVGERVLVDPWLRDPAAPDDIARATYLGSERNGGFAERVAVPSENAIAIDSPLSDVELASFPTAYLTAVNMLRRAALAAGETVLVTGASGGVGGALVQLVSAAGARAIAVTSPDKAAAVVAAGAVATIARDADDLAAALRAAAGIETVDLVADVVGGAAFPALLAVLRRGGRYVTSGAIGGPLVELDLRTLYLHDLTAIGATVPPRDAFEGLVRTIERGVLRPLVAATYPLERFREAQERFMEKRHVGNIVIDVAAAQ